MWGLACSLHIEELLICSTNIQFSAWQWRVSLLLERQHQPTASFSPPVTYMWSQEMGWLNVGQGRVLPLSGYNHWSPRATWNLQNHRTLHCSHDANLHHTASINAFTWVSTHKGLGKFKSTQSHIFHNPFPTQPHSRLWQPISQNRQGNIIHSTHNKKSQSINVCPSHQGFHPVIWSSLGL